LIPSVTIDDPFFKNGYSSGERFKLLSRYEGGVVAGGRESASAWLRMAGMAQGKKILSSVPLLGITSLRSLSSDFGLFQRIY
jgi:hypothetical protein